MDGGRGNGHFGKKTGKGAKTPKNLRNPKLFVSGHSWHGFLYAGQNKAPNLFCFGLDDEGQCGLGTRGGRRKFDENSFFSNNLIKLEGISCGFFHTLFFDDRGIAYSTGYDSNGQLARSSRTEKKTEDEHYWPGEVFRLSALPSQKKVVGVAAGGFHSLFVVMRDRDKRGHLDVYAAGSNTEGELGIAETERTATVRIPKKVVLPESNKIVKVVTGPGSSFFLMRSGVVLACGGLNTRIGVAGTPSSIPGRSEARERTVGIPSKVRFSNPDVRVKEMATGAAHAIFLTEKHGVYGVGRNDEAQLGYLSKEEIDLKQKCAIPIAKSEGSSASVLSVGCGYKYTVFFRKNAIFHMGKRVWESGLGNEEDSVGELLRFPGLSKIYPSFCVCFLQYQFGRLHAFGSNEYDIIFGGAHRGQFIDHADPVVVLEFKETRKRNGFMERFEFMVSTCPFPRSVIIFL